jgi:hypothetical protein
MGPYSIISISTPSSYLYMPPYTPSGFLLCTSNPGFDGGITTITAPGIYTFKCVYANVIYDEEVNIILIVGNEFLPDPFKTEYCITDGFERIACPKGGSNDDILDFAYYSGPGVILAGGCAIFNPAGAGVGIHTIELIPYTTGIGYPCPSNIQVKVYGQPSSVPVTVSNNNTCNTSTLSINTSDPSYNSVYTYTWSATNGTCLPTTGPNTTVTWTNPNLSGTVTLTITSVKSNGDVCGEPVVQTFSFEDCPCNNGDPTYTTSFPAGASYNPVNGNITITGTSNWTGGTYYIKGNIFVKAGATWNLNNATLYMSDKKVILIEGGDDTNNGGLVDANNTRFFAVGIDCIWQGFVIGGSANPLHDHSSLINRQKHGRLFLKGPNSRIMNAYYGVLVGGKVSVNSGNSIGTYNLPGGGIVQISNSAMIANCDVGVRFNPTPTMYDNASFFKNARFRCTSSLRKPNGTVNNRTKAFIQCNRVDELEIENTLFDNFPVSADNETKAIESTDTEYLVTNCTFTNVLYGVFAKHSVADIDFAKTIVNNTFNRTSRAISMYNSTGEVIRNNTMLNGKSVAFEGPGMIWGIGIYLQDSHDFLVANNTTHGFNISCVILNSGNSVLSSRLMKNTFNNPADYCLGTGGNNNQLFVECNAFNSYTGSASVPIGENRTAWRIYDHGGNTADIKEQGSCPIFGGGYIAGNEFSVIPPNTTNKDIIFTTTGLDTLTYWIKLSDPVIYKPDANQGPVRTPTCVTANDGLLYCATLSPMVNYPRNATVLQILLANATNKSDSARLELELFHRYLQDNNYAAAQALLNSKNNDPATQSQIDALLGQEQYAFAASLISALPNATLEQQHRKQYYTMLCTAGGCANLSPSQIAQLRMMRNMRTGIMGAAFSTLEYTAGDSIWADCPMLDLCGGSSSRYTENQEVTALWDTEKGIYFSVLYPNPAQDKVQMDYYLSQNYANAVLEVYNLMGIKIHEEVLPIQVQNHITIPVTHLPSGLYMVVVKQGSNILHKDKFNVIK